MCLWMACVILLLNVQFNTIGSTTEDELSITTDMNLKKSKYSQQLNILNSYSQNRCKQFA
jgi:hypothetical protein